MTGQYLHYVRVNTLVPGSVSIFIIYIHASTVLFVLASKRKFILPKVRIFSKEAIGRILNSK